MDEDDEEVAALSSATESRDVPSAAQSRDMSLEKKKRYGRAGSPQQTVCFMLKIEV